MSRLGFIGTGVMGEPMCRHLAVKGNDEVIAFDRDPAPLERLAGHGVTIAGSVPEVVHNADILFVSLPSGKHLEAVCEGEEGVLANAAPGLTFVDLGTSPLALTRALAGRFADAGLDYADAPVARTRAAAEEGTLAITVGASDATFAMLEPLLRRFASEVTHCGAVGTGQIVKILNNMVVVGTVISLCEAAAIAGKADVETGALFEALAKGSADSFALRNHGMKAVVPGAFPERAFSAEYMLKDIGYALEMAADGGLDPHMAARAKELLSQAVSNGDGAKYWPIISRLIGAG